jgi:hypothetical protein
VRDAGDGDGLAVAEVLLAAGGLLAGWPCAGALAAAVGLPLAAVPCPLHPATGKTIKAATIRPQAFADLFIRIPHPVAYDCVRRTAMKVAITPSVRAGCALLREF